MAPRLKSARSIGDEEKRLTAPSSPLLAPQDGVTPELSAAFDLDIRIDDEEDENARLLSDHGEKVQEEKLPVEPKPRGLRLPTACAFLTALIGTVILLLVGSKWVPTLWPVTGCIDGPACAIVNNGTHPWRKTVLLVSLDGFRADYLSKNLTTHLHDISLKGLRAKHMQPIFPSLTFPNHWALMTGLYAESHGIVANNFWDPETGDTFLYTDPAKSWNASWWNGEPIWETAVKAGIITANLMWPGPPITQSGVSPNYYVPFKDKVPVSWKHDQIFEWLDLPLDQRPRLITVYEPSVDQAGHQAGPDSELVNAALRNVDVFAHSIHQSLAARNLTDIVDVIFVSDHGMTDTSDLRVVYIDDVLGDGFHQIEHEDGWPSMGFRFKAGTNETEMVRRLQAAADKFDNKAFAVYTKETLPERYHFSNNPRIAPVWVIPHLGWALTNRYEHLTLMNGTFTPRGIHGYDNQEIPMRAMFVADGPFSTKAKAKAAAVSSKQGSDLGSRDGGEPFVIENFENVQIYGLVAKLLGLKAAPTNGTAGFWDQYLD